MQKFSISSIYIEKYISPMENWSFILAFALAQLHTSALVLEHPVFVRRFAYDFRSVVSSSDLIC